MLRLFCIDITSASLYDMSWHKVPKLHQKVVFSDNHLLSRSAEANLRTKANALLPINYCCLQPHTPSLIDAHHNMPQTPQFEHRQKRDQQVQHIERVFGKRVEW